MLILGETSRVPNLYRSPRCLHLLILGLGLVASLLVQNALVAQLHRVCVLVHASALVHKILRINILLVQERLRGVIKAHFEIVLPLLFSLLFCRVFGWNRLASLRGRQG